MNPDLTPRETEVVRLTAAGLSDRQIAAALRIALATAKRHAQNIRSKTGCSNRTQIALYAVVHKIAEVA